MTVMSGHEMYLQTAFMIADMFHVHAGHKLQILAIAIDAPWEFPSKDPRVTHIGSQGYGHCRYEPNLCKNLSHV